MVKEIFSLEEQALAGKKVAFIGGNGNRDIDKSNLTEKMKSIAESGQLAALIVVSGEKVVEAGLHLKEPISGISIEDTDAKSYLVIIEGQHRYLAIMELRGKDENNKKKSDTAIQKWERGGQKGDKPEKYIPIAPQYIYATYPLNEELPIQDLIMEINSKSRNWTKKNFASHAAVVNSENEAIQFINKYMKMTHQRTKKEGVDDMLPNGGYSLSTLSKYLTYENKINDKLLANFSKGKAELPTCKVDRAEEIIQAGLKIGFTHRFLAKRFFIDWIMANNRQDIIYTQLLANTENANKQLVDSIMENIDDTNFMGELDKLK